MRVGGFFLIFFTLRSVFFNIYISGELLRAHGGDLFAHGAGQRLQPLFFEKFPRVVPRSLREKIVFLQVGDPEAGEAVLRRAGDLSRAPQL